MPGTRVSPAGVVGVEDHGQNHSARRERSIHRSILYALRIYGVLQSENRRSSRGENPCGEFCGLPLRQAGGSDRE